MAEKLDINRVTIEDLEKIPGVTRSLAQRIISTREKLGGFTNIAALRDINGVTPELFAVLKENFSRYFAGVTRNARLNATSNLLRVA